MSRQQVKLQELVIRRLVEARGGDPDSLIDVVRVATSAGFTSAHIIEWAMCRNELGKFPTTAELAEWANITERGAWKRRAAIHEAFPGDELVTIVEDVAAALRRSRRASSSAADLLVPA